MLENLYWIIIEDSLIVDNTIIIIYILQTWNGEHEHTKNEQSSKNVNGSLKFEFISMTILKVMLNGIVFKKIIIIGFVGLAEV